jgi:hypothetical protein
MTVPYLSVGPSFDDAAPAEDDPALETTAQAILTKLGDITDLSNAIRVLARSDAGTAGMVTALAEINTGGTATFDNTTDALESINAKLAKVEATTAGTTSGAGTSTEVFVGSEVTVTVTAEDDGNRSAVVVS